jgi:hypothetical protein
VGTGVGGTGARKDEGAEDVWACIARTHARQGTTSQSDGCLSVEGLWVTKPREGALVHVVGHLALQQGRTPRLMSTTESALSPLDIQLVAESEIMTCSGIVNVEVRGVVASGRLASGHAVDAGGHVIITFDGWPIHLEDATVVRDNVAIAECSTVRDAAVDPDEHGYHPL